MDDIRELKKKRFQFLHSAYKRSGGGWSAGPNTTEYLSGYEIGELLGFDQQTTENILRYLKDEYLIELKAHPWYITITHWGIKEVEEALENPDQPTEHFLPINIIQVDTMIGSQIQQSSPGATQVVTINTEEREKLEEIIQSLKQQLDDFGLNQQEKSDLNAEISTVESQMSSSKPSSGVLKEALAKIPNILAKATATVLATDLVNRITTWLGL